MTMPLPLFQLYKYPLNLSEHRSAKMKLLLWLLFLFTSSQALLSLAHGNSEGLQLLQYKQNKAFNDPTESNKKGPGAFYINRLLYSSGRAASGGAGRAIRGGGTSIVNHPKGSNRSGASSMLASSPFSINNTLVLVSMTLLLCLMFF